MDGEIPMYFIVIMDKISTNIWVIIDFIQFSISIPLSSARLSENGALRPPKKKRIRGKCSSQQRRLDADISTFLCTI